MIHDSSRALPTKERIKFAISAAIEIIKASANARMILRHLKFLHNSFITLTPPLYDLLA
ncbi:hypothetical protein [Ruminococcus flavefaciens]|uniref:hypothetical protein n=1 Tax=Ruminococcus flavefaciens TaxID=1265 RepID=UPI0026ED2E6D|nr:hypothetical protein [Ruminococcus flavefaciens]